MHALAHTLGALYDAHHGLLNAILMPYVLTANRPAISQRIERLARYLDLATPDFDGFLAWVLELRASLGIPHALNALNIDQQQASRVGQMSMNDPAAGGNPIVETYDTTTGIGRGVTYDVLHDRLFFLTNSAVIILQPS